MGTVSDPNDDDNDVVMNEFVAHYYTKALYVDYDKKRVLVRGTNQDEQGSAKEDDRFIDYDIIIGCDGIRSVVRNAIASTNRNFEFSITDTFGLGKAFHVDCPPGVDPGTFFLLINAVPNMISFTLPETGNKFNVNLGFRPDQKDTIDPVLFTDDVDEISAYFKKHFHAFKMDCDDAAHATSPQIGQGMNTALADAAALDEMLDRHKDDWNATLETFSNERVKEGNALTS